MQKPAEVWLLEIPTKMTICSRSQTHRIVLVSMLSFYTSLSSSSSPSSSILLYKASALVSFQVDFLVTNVTKLMFDFKNGILKIPILVSRPDALPNLPSANCIVQCPEMCPCLLKTCWSAKEIVPGMWVRVAVPVEVEWTKNEPCRPGWALAAYKSAGVQSSSGQNFHSIDKAAGGGES